MFKGPFLDEFSDEEATEDTTTQVVLNETSSVPSNEITSTSCPTATQDPFLEPAARTTRPSLFLDDLPSQTMTESDIAEAQAAVRVAQTRAYEPSRAAHTFRPIYPVHLNDFQSPNTTTPRLPSTPNPRDPANPNPRPSFNPFTNAPPIPDAETIAKLSQLPLQPPIMNADEIETLLAPVNIELQKLKRTSMPPDNGRVKGKSAIQVLKGRLLPIGGYITQHTANMGEDRRGRAETEVCRHIAEQYWPQNLRRVDGLMIMEMYRNSVFVEKVRHEQWLVEVEVEEEASRVRAEEEEADWKARAEEEEMGWRARAERGEVRWEDQAEEEEPAWMFESPGNAFAGESKEKMAGLDMWTSHGEENFGPAPLPGEVMPGLEIGETDDEGNVSMVDDLSGTDWTRWPWGQPKGG